MKALAISGAQHKAYLARWALEAEAELTPKPALVDRRSSGAHGDMNIALMQRSARTLEPWFTKMAALTGPRNSDFRAALGLLGREAEAEMLAETGGINTHRGAIWALGLLLAAEGDTPKALLASAANLARLEDPFMPARPASHGEQAVARFGISGAKAQAQAGFPQIHNQGLPVLRQSRQRGDIEAYARLNSLLAIMSALTDTCVLYRAGIKGQNAMQQGALAVLDAGGAGTFAGRRALTHLDNRLLALNASAGGAADLLAATLLTDALCPEQEG
ncbi:triphosphoribosyl-dephospho-CoA synthase [Gallaecimonas mangrovi]|uniref:triphosphoribosyl-dephospho-CoA synthase n=1 Tax=Gallaecimonas mangrovi TaxID=2291597 RepID=UPI000E2088DC|nr:triphosphoribosyl-dephospho-CoA synthase [Gallaecimonas mangrovi]